MKTFKEFINESAFGPMGGDQRSMRGSVARPKTLIMMVSGMVNLST